MAKQNVVIVGGGGYGATLARAFSSKLDSSRYNITLVSSRSFFTHLPATLRMIVTSDGDLEKRALIDYDRLFVNGNGTFIQKTVVSVHKNDASGKSGHILLSDGEELSWDALILTPGSKWEAGLEFPDSRSEAESFVNEWRAKFKKADSILLAGGGAVGIELAGELRDVYPKKEITIVHADKNLLNDTYPIKFRSDVERRMKIRDIQLILSNHIDKFPEGEGRQTVTTREGKILEADLIVPTRGGKPNTAFLSSLSPSPLNPDGYIKVKPTLQVANEINIFATGDAIDFHEQKQLGKAAGHVDVVVQNVISVLEGQPLKKTYKGTFEAIFITIGKAGGAGFLGKLWGLQFGDKIVSMVKSKTLFVDMVRKNLGATA